MHPAGMAIHCHFAVMCRGAASCGDHLRVSYGNFLEQGVRQATAHNLQHSYVIACNVASPNLIESDRGRAVAGKPPLATAAYQQGQQPKSQQTT